MIANDYGFLLRYSNSNSILVVTIDNRLIELACPFKVEMIKAINNLIVFRMKKVTQVKLSTNGKIVYIIDNEPYYYSLFEILL